MSVSAHRKAAFPGIRGQVFFADAGDLDIVAFLDHVEQLREFFLAALYFQRHAAVVLVLHPAGQFQRLGGIVRAVAEPDSLYLPGDGIAAAHSAFRQGGRGTVFLGCTSKPSVSTSPA